MKILKLQKKTNAHENCIHCMHSTSMHILSSLSLASLYSEWIETCSEIKWIWTRELESWVCERSSFDSNSPGLFPPYRFVFASRTRFVMFIYDCEKYIYVFVSVRVYPGCHVCVSAEFVLSRASMSSRKFNVFSMFVRCISVISLMSAKYEIGFSYMLVWNVSLLLVCATVSGRLSAFFYAAAAAVAIDNIVCITSLRHSLPVSRALFVPCRAINWNFGRPCIAVCVYVANLMKSRQISGAYRCQ